MTSEKNSIWKKFAYYWLSPLLLVSLGLHGLGLLMPVPDSTPEDIEKPDIELPEPIQVTELPLKPEPEPVLVPEPIFIPPPPAVIEPPPVVIEPPVIEPPVIDPPVIEPSPNVEPLAPEPVPEPVPESVPETELEPDPAPQPISDPNAQKPGKTPGTPQNYVPGSQFDSTNVSLIFGAKYGNGDAVSTPLVLTFLADEGVCYENGPTIDVPVLIAVDNQGYVVLEKDENGEDRDAITIVETSGYEDIDGWLLELLAFELPEETFEALPDLDNGDIAAWINEVHGQPNSQPLVPAGEDNAPYAFTARVTIEGGECEAP